MSNQTLVQVPAKISSEKELRVFLVRLVEQLDIVLGFRGDAGFSAEITDSVSTLSKTIEDQLAELQKLIQTNAENIDKLQKLIQTNAENIDELQNLTYNVDTYGIVAEIEDMV